MGNSHRKWQPSHHTSSALFQQKNRDNPDVTSRCEFFPFGNRLGGFCQVDFFCAVACRFVGELVGICWRKCGWRSWAQHLPSHQKRSKVCEMPELSFAELSGGWLLGLVVLGVDGGM